MSYYTAALLVNFLSFSHLRAGAYLSKIDEMNFSLEVSTTSLLISVFSREEYRHHVKSLPEKYHFLVDFNK